MRVVAGIDSSTQSCTVLLREAESGKSVALGRGRHPSTTPPVSEQNPEDWWAGLRQAMRQALAHADGEVEVVAVSVDAQAHGLVALDEENKVLRPAKLWNDTTSVAEARELVQRLGAEEWARRAGSVPPGAFTISKILWVARNEPDVFKRIRKILLPHDWLTYKLTGQFVTDPGDASGTGYYTPASGTWDLGLLDLVDPSTEWEALLPRLLLHDDIAGDLTEGAARHLGLTPGIPVAAGTADNQASAVGMGIELGDVVVSLGTSGVVFSYTDQPVYDPTGTFNGNADATGGYLPVLCTLNAAKVTDTFARILNVDHQALSELALAAPVHHPRRPVLAAYLDGERVPDRPDASGTLTGLRTDTTAEGVARAAFEGVLAGLVVGIRRLGELGVSTRGRLAVTGGGAQSPAYRQLLADMTGRQVHLVDEAESAAAGAAVQARAALGDMDVTNAAGLWSPTWTPVAQPRPGSDPEQTLSRYTATAAWSALESPGHAPINRPSGRRNT